jgi:deoxyribose-phosphate aldolase
MPTSLDDLIAQAEHDLDRGGIPRASRLAPAPVRGRTIARPGDLAAYIEHTVLKADATPSAVAALCAEAREHDLRAVCVNPLYVERAKRLLSGTSCLVVTVVGFPLGANVTDIKAREAESAIRSGADEIDMVIPVGLLRAEEHRTVFDDIRAVVEACGTTAVKVILENALLDERQKVLGCLLAERAGAAFVKTSSGFAVSGAMVDDVRLMKRVVGERMGIKAAGGIRDFETARAMVEAGATRIGTSASLAIVRGFAD